MVFQENKKAALRSAARPIQARQYRLAAGSRRTPGRMIGVRVVEDMVNHGMRLLSVGMVERVEFTSAARERQEAEF